MVGFSLAAQNLQAQGENCNGVDAWASTAVYTNSDGNTPSRVVYNGNLYQNKWWTQNNRPDLFVDLTPDKSDGTKHWLLLGTCQVGSTSRNTWVLDEQNSIILTDPKIARVNINTTAQDEPTLNTSHYRFNVKGRVNFIGDDNVLELWSATKANAQVGGRRQYLTFNNSTFTNGLPYAFIGSNSFLLNAKPTETQPTDLILQPNAGSKLGIGSFTSSPLATLHVNGDVLANSNITSNGSLTSGGYLYVNGSDLRLGVKDGRYAGNPSDVEDIQQRALVHLGDDPTKPNPKLDLLVINFNNDFRSGVLVQSNLQVTGKIATTEVCVNPTASWCDYVFEKDYKLMPLNKLKTYIAENKHLPEIPTTAEIKQSGVNLGEINVLYLKKIEELTLYLLQLEERLKIAESKLK